MDPSYFLDNVKTLQLTRKASRNSRDLTLLSSLSCLLMLCLCPTCSNSTELHVVPQIYQNIHYHAVCNALFQMAHLYFSSFVLKTKFTHNSLCKDFNELARPRSLSSEQPLYPENNLNTIDHFLVCPSHYRRDSKLPEFMASLMSEQFCHTVLRSKEIPNSS